MVKTRKYPDGTKTLVRTLEAMLEIVMLMVLYYLVWRNGYDHGIFPDFFGKGKYVLTGVYALIIITLMNNFDGFMFGYLKRTDVLVSQVIAIFIANFITYWQLCLIANALVAPMPICMLMVLDLLVVLVCSMVYDSVYHMLYTPKNMVMVIGRNEAVTLKFKMESRADKYNITKLLHEDLGMEKITRQLSGYDAVIINDVSAQLRNDLLKYCYQNEIRTYVAPKISDLIVRGAKDINLFDTPLLLVKGRGLNTFRRMIKRLMDIIICLAAMPIAAPIMAVAALAIKLEDGGPVFFKQKRATIGGEEFEILKFRSMIVDAEKGGYAIPATDRDPRITKVGQVIRATRIDELPQLLNILKGDMSVVGPRPERLEHVEQYSKDIPEFALRLKVKGGLTGYAQIYGKYNTSAYDKLRLDLMYIENYSLMMDIKLILMTIRIMLKRESTEGFDKVREMEKLKKEALQQLAREGEENPDTHCAV